MNQPLRAIAAACICAAAASVAMADVIPVDLHADAGFIDSTGAASNGFPYAGSTSPADQIRSAIFIFELPALPVGHAITSADLTVYLEANSVGSVNGDVYAIRTSAATGKLTTDYFTGAYGTDAAATAIMDDIVIPSSAVGSYSTDAAADTALGAWLQNEYDDGAVAGEYAFLRINVDDLPGSTYDLYRFSEVGDDNPAVLTITTTLIPEPASIAMLTLAGIAMVGKRRR